MDGLHIKMKVIAVYELPLATCVEFTMSNPDGTYGRNQFVWHDKKE